MVDWIGQMDQDGFAIVPGVFSARDVKAVLDELTAALGRGDGEPASIRSREGGVYAARNVLTLWPAVALAWQRAPLPEILTSVLGAGYGLVRVLFFDKPPAQTWSLPWHKDLTIAVRDNHIDSRSFGKPTCKAGVPHVEAPQEVLEAMLTARIHLDEITEENGPMRVLPGSHRSGKTMAATEGQPRDITVKEGDVLLFRPLLAHSSAASLPGTLRHRRVLHLEFAASDKLPDGYAWHDFIPPERHD
jgi:hypothetical protein